MPTSIDQLITRASIEGVGSVVADLKKLGDAFDDVGSGGDGEDAFAKLGESANNLGNVLGAVGAAGATALGFLAKAAMDAENRLAAMKTAFGGNEAAAKSAYKWIEKYSNATPFKTSDIQSAATKLKGAGLDYQTWVDIAAKMAASKPGKTVDDAAEAIKDAQMGEMERLKEFDIGTAQLLGYGGTAQAGQANAEANMAALKAFVQGNMGTALADAMDTASGQLSTMLSKLDKAAAGLGKNLLPEMNKAIGKVTELADAFNGLDDRTKQDIVTLLKWGTAGAIVLSGSLKLLAVLSTIRTAMNTGAIAKARNIALEKAETAAVREGAGAQYMKAQAYLAARNAATKAEAQAILARAGIATGPTAAAAGGGLWARGSMLRLGVGAAGLGLLGYGLYQGYQSGRANGGKDLSSATIKNPGFWAGGAMTSIGAMAAVKALFGTSWQTTLVVGVAAAVAYGISTALGRRNSAFSIDNIRGQAEAAMSGTQYTPLSKLYGDMLPLATAALDRLANVVGATTDAFDRLASSGILQGGNQYGQIYTRGTNRFGGMDANIELARDATTIPISQISSLVMQTMRQVPQSQRLGEMERMYRGMATTADKTLGAMLMSTNAIVGMADAVGRQAKAAGRKADPKFSEAAEKALDQLEDSIRGFAAGLTDAARRIQAAKLDQVSDRLSEVGDMLQGIEAGLIPEKLRDSYRARRDDLTRRRADMMRAMGDDVDAAAVERQLGMTRLREAKSDQQDYLDKLREQLTSTMGEYDVGRDFGKLSRSQKAALAGSAPGWFGPAAGALPTAADVLSKFDELIMALENAGKATEADQASLDKIRWQMQQMADREKPKPNIAREILSTGGISGLAEAAISRVVSGGYFGRRQSGVYGPYALSGAQAARVRASVSNENERHFRMDLYVHPDDGAADAIAKDAVAQTIRALPRAFRGAGMTAQMQP